MRKSGRFREVIADRNRVGDRSPCVFKICLTNSIAISYTEKEDSSLIRLIKHRKKER